MENTEMSNEILGERKEMMKYIYLNGVTIRDIDDFDSLYIYINVRKTEDVFLEWFVS
jgi:hypothetical protein